MEKERMIKMKRIGSRAFAAAMAVVLLLTAAFAGTQAQAALPPLDGAVVVTCGPVGRDVPNRLAAALPSDWISGVISGYSRTFTGRDGAFEYRIDVLQLAGEAVGKTDEVVTAVSQVPGVVSVDTDDLSAILQRVPYTVTCWYDASRPVERADFGDAQNLAETIVTFDALPEKPASSDDAIISRQYAVVILRDRTADGAAAFTQALQRANREIRFHKSIPRQSGYGWGYNLWYEENGMLCQKQLFESAYAKTVYDQALETAYRNYEKTSCAAMLGGTYLMWALDQLQAELIADRYADGTVYATLILRDVKTPEDCRNALREAGLEDGNIVHVRGQDNAELDELCPAALVKFRRGDEEKILNLMRSPLLAWAAVPLPERPHDEPFAIACVEGQGVFGKVTGLSSEGGFSIYEYNRHVTARDARYILRMSAKLEAPNQAYKLTMISADVDMDGEITARDARLALRISAKLAPEIDFHTNYAYEFSDDFA